MSDLNIFELQKLSEEPDEEMRAKLEAHLKSGRHVWGKCPDEDQLCEWITCQICFLDPNEVSHETS